MLGWDTICVWSRNAVDCLSNETFKPRSCSNARTRLYAWSHFQYLERVCHSCMPVRGMINLFIKIRFQILITVFGLLREPVHHSVDLFLKILKSDWYQLQIKVFYPSYFLCNQPFDCTVWLCAVLAAVAWPCHSKFFTLKFQINTRLHLKARACIFLEIQ